MNRKPGRPSKGPRERVHVRQPVDLHRAATKAAAALGLTMNDYLNSLVARDVGMTYGEQEDLGLKASA